MVGALRHRLRRCIGFHALSGPNPETTICGGRKTGGLSHDATWPPRRLFIAQEPSTGMASPHVDRDPLTDDAAVLTFRYAFDMGVVTAA